MWYNNMNRYKTELELFELFNSFRYHESILDEIMELVVKKGRTKKFYAMLEKSIRMIEELGEGVIKLNSFEKLQNITNMYSMKFKSNDMNLRILYKYDDEYDVLLLCAFEEKSDSGKDSYRKHIPIASKRMLEMEGSNER